MDFYIVILSGRKDFYSAFLQFFSRLYFSFHFGRVLLVLEQWTWESFACNVGLFFSFLAAFLYGLKRVGCRPVNMMMRVCLKAGQQGANRGQETRDRDTCHP